MSPSAALSLQKEHMYWLSIKLFIQYTFSSRISKCIFIIMWLLSFHSQLNETDGQILCCFLISPSVNNINQILIQQIMEIVTWLKLDSIHFYWTELRFLEFFKFSCYLFKFMIHSYLVYVCVFYLTYSIIISSESTENIYMKMEYFHSTLRIIVVGHHTP